MTGKTHFGILAGIDDLVPLAAAIFRVKASGAVAHLATLDLDTFHRDGDAFMRRTLELFRLLFMARGTNLRTDILGAFHLVGFENFFKRFDVDIAAGGEKTQRTKKENCEDYFFAMMANGPFDRIHLLR